jgi:hypothetical protein
MHLRPRTNVDVAGAGCLLSGDLVIMTSSGGEPYDFRQSGREGDKRGEQEVEQESVHLQGAVFRNPVTRIR